MALFGKNPNERFYYQGKKHFVDVLKNTGPASALIWRQPEEDFNTNSTLIVMPGEVAIFVKGGHIEEIFENGTYKLTTNNYPFLSRLRNAASGGISAFNCVVYFVRRADTPEIKWGTMAPIHAVDKKWGLAKVDVRARAVYKVHIDDPGIFLEKLVGSREKFETPEDLNRFFAGEFQGRVRDALAKCLNAAEEGLIGIEEHLTEVSDKVEPFLNESLKSYGLRCIKFSMVAIEVDGSQYEEINKARQASIARREALRGEAEGKDLMSREDWAYLHQIGVLTEAAKNEGSTGTMAGLGMGLAAGTVFGGMTNNMVSQSTASAQQPQYQQPQQGQPQYQQPQYQQPQQGQPQYQQPQYQQPQQQQPQPQETAQPTPPVEDPLETLTKLKRLLDAGLIEQAEYDAKKTEILSRM